MPLSFANSLEQIHSNSLYLISTEALHELTVSGRLDIATALHSQRTSRMCQVLSYAAGLNADVSIALAIGAELHDTGKEYCLDIVTSDATLTHETRAILNEHPKDSLKFINELYKDKKTSSIPTMAGILAVGHHTHHKDDF